jgi:hypothetical protein
VIGSGQSYFYLDELDPEATRLDADSCRYELSLVVDLPAEIDSRAEAERWRGPDRVEGDDLLAWRDPRHASASPAPWVLTELLAGGGSTSSDWSGLAGASVVAEAPGAFDSTISIGLLELPGLTVSLWERERVGGLGSRRRPRGPPPSVSVRPFARGAAMGCGA